MNVFNLTCILLFIFWNLSLRADVFENVSPTNEMSVVFTNYKSLLRAQSKTLGTNLFELNYDLHRISPELIKNILGELQSVAFRQLVSETNGNDPAPCFHEYLCLEDNILWLDFSIIPKKYDQLLLGKLKKRVKFYLEGRFGGHTTNYLYQAILNTRSSTLTIPAGFPLKLITEKWIPTGWTNLINQHDYWVVIDGSYAWIYDDKSFIQKRDRKEFDEKYKLKFEFAKSEAEEILNQRGQRSLDSSMYLNSEIKRILKDKYNIDWLSPEELRDNQ